VRQLCQEVGFFWDSVETRVQGARFMSRAINIGELLQSGMLGGAQIYNQQASRRQQGEIANRELDQREAIRNDRLVETEFQRQQQLAAAQRMLDQEAADGAIFSALWAPPPMGPFQPGMEPPDPIEGIDINTMVRASPRAQDQYARARGNREAYRKNIERLQTKKAGLKSAGVLPFLVPEEAREMLDAGIQFDEDEMPHSLRDETEAGQAAIRDANLAVLTEFSQDELANFATIRADIYNRDYAKLLSVENAKRREARMKAQSEQMTPEMLSAAVQNQMVLNPTWTPQQAQAFVMEREAGRVNQTDAYIGSRGPDQTKALMDQMKVLDAIVAPYLDTTFGGLKKNAPAKAQAAMRLREDLESRLMQSMGQSGGGGMGGGAGEIPPDAPLVINGQQTTAGALGGVDLQALWDQAQEEFNRKHGRYPDEPDVQEVLRIRDELMRSGPK
jgi:hypothetical protein